MNYSLAMELKKAGFPMTGVTWTWKIAEDGTDKEHVPNPTLEELINACGEDIWTLKRATGPEGKKGWIVGQDGKQDADHTEWDIIQFGSTPTEAVAKLWLALNKK